MKTEDTLILTDQPISQADFPLPVGFETRPRWIAIEGGEGVGKTTQVARVTEALNRQNLPAISIRTPGGTPAGARIRSMLVDANRADSDLSLEDVTEELLHAADLAEMAAAIRSALSRGFWVVSDRSHYSSFAYSTHGKQNPAEWESLFRLAVAGLEPDLVVWIDVDPNEGRRRALDHRGASTDTIDAYDTASEAFYQRIYDYYQTQYATARNWQAVRADELAAAEVTERIVALVDRMRFATGARGPRSVEAGS